MSANQIWIFLGEKVESSEFKLGHKTLAELQNKDDLTMADCLRYAGITGHPAEFSFWMSSPSMKAAVQLLNDRSIIVMHKLYCAREITVTIHIRPDKDPSPNTTRAASYASSLQQSRKISGQHIPELPIRPPLRHSSKNLDPLTGEPLKDLDPSEQVTISFGQCEVEVFSRDYLLGWIQSQAADGKDITDIEVQAITQRGRPIKFLLKPEVWMTSLLRGPWKEAFQKVWDERKGISLQRSEALAGLYAIPNFSRSAQLFIRDLKCFSSDVKAQERLQSTKHEFYLGMPYFDDETVAKILTLPVGDGRLNDKLVELVERKKERGQLDELCASHDLAPVFQYAFEIRYDKAVKEDVLADLTNLSLGKESRGKQLVKKASKMLLGKK